MMCGLCAALAAVVDLSAGIFLLLLAGVILGFRWKWSMRIGGVILYIVGATPPIVLHAALTVPMTGDLRPGIFHTELSGLHPPMVIDTIGASTVEEPEESVGRGTHWKSAAFRSFDRAIGALLGGKGLFSHYPVVIVGVVGLGMVLRRHWPASTKIMAAATFVGAVVVIGVSIAPRVDWGQAMFGPRWFVLFLPLVLFWAGAWLRRPHHLITWSVAGVLLAFSMGVSVIGAVSPGVAAAEGEYTVVAALKKMLHENEKPERTMVAGRE
jgi:hypothetical protein